ncbi:unnamed protein product [Rotaria socialis]|uniref:Iodothyronine deiodinase n=1 Tax=Rotaria socialis TaxID=392032 RepID=A0A821FQ01_9BILA|nr:unnamed protein product [Rotaria socialis]CAF4654948.1 unnamed protein product [Rotaria socialis]
MASSQSPSKGHQNVFSRFFQRLKGSKNVRHQDKQNDASQAQATIEQQTADAIAAQVKAPPINNKQHKVKLSPFSPPNLLNDNHNGSSYHFLQDFSRARCKMFFPTSGRMGFDKIKTSTEFPPIETVREMITYETSIRLSEPIQELMDFYHNDEASLSHVLDLIQQHVVEHFGYHDVNALRTAFHRFPDDPVVKSAYYEKRFRNKSYILFLLLTHALFRSHAPNGLCFLVIYIVEAHARDEWPMGKIISRVDQPITLEQRLVNARECQKDCKFEMPMLVDSMNNTFHLTYGSWPFRFYIIHNGILVLKAEPDNDTFSYHIDELNQWIDNYYQSYRPIA